jgi:hypothetical protein
MLKGQCDLPFAQGKGKMLAEIITIKKIFKIVICFKIPQNYRSKNKHVGY